MTRPVIGRIAPGPRHGIRVVETAAGLELRFTGRDLQDAGAPTVDELLRAALTMPPPPSEP